MGRSTADTILTMGERSSRVEARNAGLHEALPTYRLPPRVSNRRDLSFRQHGAMP